MAKAKLMFSLHLLFSLNGQKKKSKGEYWYVLLIFIGTTVLSQSLLDIPKLDRIGYADKPSRKKKDKGKWI